jgi:carbamate kinase
MARVLIALGGNAILNSNSDGTFENQKENIELACEQIVEIVNKGHNIVITHGNGPQIGYLAIQQELASGQIPQQPLFIMGAMTQGQIGFIIQQVLSNKLSGKDAHKKVVTVITQIIVDKNDAGFRNPSKPVGPFYGGILAKKLAQENNWLVKKVLPKGDKTWRRVVPSPEPLQIVEANVIKTLIDNNVIVVACGGGGIPVIQNDFEEYEGVNAVIDKDKAAARLAEEIDAEILLVLTDVEHVMKNFGKKTETPVKELKIEEANKLVEEGHFGAGSMKPKIEACIEFLEKGGRLAIITSLEKALEGLEGKTGTRIRKD